MFLPVKHAQCESLLKRWPQIFHWKAADRFHSFHPKAVLRGDLWCMNQDSLWTSIEVTTTSHTPEENETWAKLWDVMVGFGLRHTFPELPLLGNLSFPCALLYSKASKPQLNQTKPHKSPLHSSNSPNTEMDLPEISQTPGQQRQSKGRNGIPVQRLASLSFCQRSKRGLIPIRPFLSWASSCWLQVTETHWL